ncbi:PREDICTED: MAG2-interacting protein 2 [Nicotiana attenuata]|uniref:Mag2-interacting protein 2 n=1 Tax=Nicotiana attenuata TaxID=49451 RepID=A0A1J6K8Z2_NICAT|nr:PREDICTED: MAG2-interacting protein 2 [Nicotiana attenuata]OIT26501.1 mag2-interacting protein 2 [Nicotiana attenuata]
MEESASEILFETRHHASRPYISNYPPQIQQLNEGAKSSYFSRLLSSSGIAQLKERWRKQGDPTKVRRYASLFVSARGDLVAVASGNQITIMQKGDDYQKPCGIYICKSITSFCCGAWSETHDVLGVADDSDTVYLIRANGEEITRISKSHIKSSSSIVGLMVQDDADLKKSCLCTFTIVTADGLIHDVEISQDPSASVFSPLASTSGRMLQQFPQNMFCLDYHPELSLFSVVSSAGSLQLTSNGLYSLSLCRRSGNLALEVLVSTQFEGFFSMPKGYVGHITSPKVSISPQGKFVATLDMGGSLSTFNFDKEQCSLSKFVYGEELHHRNKESDKGNNLANEVVDFAWWSDDILAVAEWNGNITMINISTGAMLFKKDETMYSLPLLERVPQLAGKLFLLETKPSIQNNESTEGIRASSFRLFECNRGDMNNKFDWASIQWSLVSFSERSIPEMYDILISRQECQAALTFADHHGLDKDKALKSQWLHSSQGVNEIKTLLSNVKDQVFVLSECVGRFGPTEDAVRALLDLGLGITDRYRFSESDVDEHSKVWDFLVARLKLLQYRDRLETFLGINMGRFSLLEYKKFCNLPINDAAVALAESGKIGALNLLFKRHPYSLTSSLLDVLAAIPETLPVQTYGQLLPGSSPPPSISLREEDWVECDEMVTFIISRVPESHESYIQIRTEPIVKQFMGSQWPSVSELSSWYKKRARDIDSLSGQLDNSMCLIDFACRKGIHQLQPFLEEMSYLHQLIYSEENDEMNFSMSLTIWESLPDYERFKLMLIGVKEDTVIKRLYSKAIPFMKKRFHSLTVPSRDEKTDCSSLTNSAESFLVRWLKEIASENKLEMCSAVIEEGSGEFQNNSFFQNETEVVDCALQCIYSCSVTDRWSMMASILSKLPFSRDSEDAGLKERVRLAEGHIEAGRILALYQVPKPISFFQEAYSDEKGVKQIIRLILSKFVRRQPGRSDNDWTNMWLDLQSLQEKAFRFIDLEYMLMEFCRGLLKAGKFALARNYLKGVGSVSLANDKAENLVIQAAREYFFSASSLSCSEIWKAKECLNIFPTSRNVRVEADVIDAVTVKLPNLGVTLLPMQFRQIKDPMEIVKLVVTSQGGAYLNVDEIIELAKLLGLSSHDDISAVQEAIAREAAVVGDLQLAFDLCLVLAKKGHGSVWDLCAALARGPALENMDIASRKQLLGFALSHCDGESIAELLHAWKDLDMQDQCESLMVLTGKEPGNALVQDSAIPYQLPCNQDKADLEECSDQETQLKQIENLLFQLAKDVQMDGDWSIPSILRENGKLLSFAAVYLPWLLELSQEAESIKKFTSSSFSGVRYVSLRTQALMAILSWLARNGFAPKDSLIASVAKSIMEPPVSEEEDIIGCSFLLNLVDAFSGVEIIERNLRTREKYNEITSIMNVGMIYGLLHNCEIKCKDPAQRRDLLLTKFQQKHKLICSDEKEQIDQAQSTFWREWKLKLEEQKRIAERSRSLEQIIPGVETTRFLSGDMDYRESVVFSFVQSITPEKKHIVKDVLKLANAYSLNCSKVVLHYLRSIFVSEAWSTDDVKTEVSNHREDILACAAETIKVISSSIYPAVDGRDKKRLSLVYGLLSDCYLQLYERKDPVHSDSVHIARFSKTVEEECCKVSFIRDLNFKNIAGIKDLNLDCFNSEVSAHINENNVEALAKMVNNLVSAHDGPVPDGLLSWQYVYKHHVLSLLTNLEARAKSGVNIQSSESLHCLIGDIEQTYNACCKYLKFIPNPARLDILKKLLAVILPAEISFKRPFGSGWQVCLGMLVDTWLRMMNDMHEVALLENSEERFCLECLMTCLKVFARLVAGEKVSSSQGWATIIAYVGYVLVDDAAVEIFNFCKAMVCSGCGFGAVADVYDEVMAHFVREAGSVTEFSKEAVNIQNLQDLYVSILETILQELTDHSREHQCLHHYLSSLSKLDGDLENLQSVRQAVWERLEEFSENFHLSNHVRVYMLELMQLIAATDKNSKGFSSDLEVEVHSWEGWENLHSATANCENTAADGISKKLDASNKFTNTLIALKSTQLVSTISPSIEIAPEDLSTVESTVSCFLGVSKFAESESHVETLLAMLREWEGQFTRGETEKDSGEISDGGNSWSNDDWDEGWESFQEPIEREPKKDAELSVHPLHVCWMEIFRKLLTISQYNKMLKLLDKSLAKPGEVLLNEENAQGLSQIALGVDCFLALKLMLLLPYEVVQLQCLDIVEQKLKQEGISDKISMDLEFLVLVLSSGVISTIITKPSYGTIFSYLCYMVGNFSRQCQDSQLSDVGCGGSVESENIPKDHIDLFTRLVFPCFVSELVRSGQQILAGFLVAKFMHTNPSLSLINIAGACLTKYLERQIQILQEGNPSRDSVKFSNPLLNTVSSLRDRMENLIQSSLSLLSLDGR